MHVEDYHVNIFFSDYTTRLHTFFVCQGVNILSNDKADFNHVFDISLITQNNLIY